MKIKDPFYDIIDFDYLLKGDGQGNIYTADVMRFFECDIQVAKKIKPKIEEIARRLKWIK